MSSIVDIPSERDRFLGDVITGAVEGGTGYWAQVSQYQYVSNDGRLSVCAGRRMGDEPRAVLHPLKDDESGYEDEGKVVTLEIVRLGVERIVSGEVGVHKTIRASIMQAYVDMDAGDIDSDAADVIVQAGLFGEVVYQ